MFNSLRRFRAGVYGAFEARRDALFELLDAATVAGLVPSLAHLSLTAVHRRGWGSLYDALSAGTMDASALRVLVGRWPLDDGQPIYALDTSVWPRDDAAAVGRPTDRCWLVVQLARPGQFHPR
jgi:hypothetical protein